MKTFTIGTNDANQRFDKYLKKLLPNASVSFLYKMLRKKNITSVSYTHLTLPTKA